MILDRHVHEMFGLHSVAVHVRRSHCRIKAGEGEAGGNFKRDICRGCEGISDAGGVERGHFFRAANQHHVCHARGDCHHTLPKRKSAGGTGAFDSGGRNGRETNGIRKQRRDMRLMFKLVTGEIADIKQFNDRRVEAFVYRLGHFLECFDKKIAAVLFCKRPELGHTCADNSNSARQGF